MADQEHQITPVIPLAIPSLGQPLVANEFTALDNPRMSTRSQTELLSAHIEPPAVSLAAGSSNFLTTLPTVPNSVQTQFIAGQHSMINQVNTPVHLRHHILTIRLKILDHFRQWIKTCLRLRSRRHRQLTSRISWIYSHLWAFESVAILAHQYRVQPQSIYHMWALIHQLFLLSTT